MNDRLLRLESLTTDDLANVLLTTQTVLVPVGAVEQHFDFLPLGTDTYAATRVAEDVARTVNAVVAPPLWYGFSPHHMWSAGTITLQPETLGALIADVCCSLAAHGFRLIAIVNGHRIANLVPLQLGAWRAVEATAGAQIRVFDLQTLAKDICKELDLLPFGHCDPMETAHMMYLRPELVKRDKIPMPSSPPSETPAIVEETSFAYVPQSSKTRGGTGATQFAHKANAERGALLHDRVVARLARELLGAPAT